MQEYVLNESGERVLPGSRRPDGTLRKERKIRAGYTPQDEQPVYQSAGALFKQAVPRCPGFDDSDLVAAQQTAKTKAQKKNEKRKQKKTDGGSGGSQPDARAEAAEALKEFQELSIGQATSVKATGPKQTTTPPEPASALDPTEKRIRVLRKKVRECDALLERKKAGESMTQPEQEKLSKLPAWQGELDELEATVHH